MLGGMLCRVAACSPAWTARALFDFSSHARKGDSRSEYRGGTQARDRRGPGGSAAPRACPGAACVGLSDSRGAVTTPQLGEGIGGLVSMRSRVGEINSAPDTGGTALRDRSTAEPVH